LPDDWRHLQGCRHSCLPSSTVEAVRRLGPLPAKVGRLTETSTISSAPAHALHEGAAGYIAPGVSIRAVDDEGTILGQVTRDRCRCKRRSM
jgi:hypothetical protein